VLRDYGFDETRLRAVRCDSLEVMAADGSTLSRVLASNIVREYGSPWYMCHRVDLHNELKHLAFDEAEDGRPAKLHLNSKVVRVDPEEGQITLASGDVHHGDLVVGADGIYVCISLLPPRPLLPGTTGQRNSPPRAITSPAPDTRCRRRAATPTAS